jgi:hypothetical protein
MRSIAEIDRKKTRIGNIELSTPPGPRAEMQIHVGLDRSRMPGQHAVTTLPVTGLPIHVFREGPRRGWRWEAT